MPNLLPTSRLLLQGTMLVALLQPSPGECCCWLLGPWPPHPQPPAWRGVLACTSIRHSLPSQFPELSIFLPAETFELFDDVMLLASGMVSQPPHPCLEPIICLLCQPLLCPRLPLPFGTPP